MQFLDDSLLLFKLILAMLKGTFFANFTMKFLITDKLFDIFEIIL